MNYTYRKSLITEYGAVKSADDYYFTLSLPEHKSACVAIYDLSGKLLDTVNPDDYRLAGNTDSFAASGLPKDGIQYEYICDDTVTDDPYMRAHSFKRQYGTEPGTDDSDRNVCTGLTYDWEGDECIGRDFSDVLAYQLHVRGFTKHPSSKVKGKGCFLGITEKIPYFNELSINQIELMPSYEFCEFDYEKPYYNAEHPVYQTDVTLDAEGNTVKNVPKLKLNYWGYKAGSYFCPKYNYAYSNDPITEFKDMVKALHKAGIEIIMQMFFAKGTDASLIRDCLRFWHIEYHIDGFHLMGENLPLNIVFADGILSDCKLYVNNIDRNSEMLMNSPLKYAADINSGVMYSARKFLKSDSDSLAGFVNALRSNPSRPYSINYLTCYEGFTLNDLVSYDNKHNEDNGENNTDGTDYNVSWNCGFEGPSSKKSVKELRIRQIKNALCFLLLSRGTPMLFMGDEMMNSQSGKNNPYCHDSSLTWLNWKRTKASDEIFEFTKKLIKIRKENSILHEPGELRGMDYRSKGYPDISYHQDMAWKADFSCGMLHFAAFLYGAYAKDCKCVSAGNESDEADSLYIAYNMHWTDHTFGMPRLKSGMRWELVAGSCTDEEAKAFSESLNKGTDEINVYKRSVLILKSCAVKEEK